MNPIDKAMWLADEYAARRAISSVMGMGGDPNEARAALRAHLEVHMSGQLNQAVAPQACEVADEGTPIDPREPRLHTDFVDVLPEDHPLARENVYCDACPEMLHAFNNECMRTWVEMPGRGNFCLRCYAKADGYPWPRDGSEDANDSQPERDEKP